MTSLVLAGDVFEEISLCEKKIVQMQEEVMECMRATRRWGRTRRRSSARTFRSANAFPLKLTCITNVAPTLLVVQFQGFLESRLPSDNLRIKIEEHVSHMSVFENEGPDNDGVLSRIERRNQSQRICDLKSENSRFQRRVIAMLVVKRTSREQYCNGQSQNDIDTYHAVQVHVCFSRSFIALDSLAVYNVLLAFRTF